MERLVYTPQVECLVMLEEQRKLIDISDDIVSGSVNRRLNAMSDISLTLQNKDGRYTKQNMIQPMDRIILRMSRVGKPFLVFSGFVDDAPYYQLFPGTVTLAASDTLKLLHHTYFDPGLPFVQSWFLRHGWNYNPDTGTLWSPTGLGNDDIYGGMKDIIYAMINEIGNWPTSAIGIYDLPSSFLQSISKVMQDASDEASAIYDSNLALLTKLFGAENFAGTPTGQDTTGVLPTTGNITISDVGKVALAAGFSADDAVIAVAIAGMESGFKTNAVSSTNDYGLWQINNSHSSNPLLNGDMTKAFDPRICAQIAYQLYSSRKQSQGNGCRFADWTTYRLVNSNPGSGCGFLDWNSGSADLKAKYASLLAQAQQAITIDATAGAAPLPSPTTSQSNTQTDRQSAPTTIADNILTVATQELNRHVTENLGTNDSTRIRVYDAYVGIAPPAPWCAAFASWVYGQAGMTSIKSPSVAGLEALGSRVATPKPADMIHWGDAHVGIVTGVQGSNYSFIAGNQGNGVNTGSGVIGQPSNGTSIIPTFLRFNGVGDASSTTVAGTVMGNQNVQFTAQQIEQLGAAGAFFTQQFQSSDQTLSIALTGERAIANDVPIIEWIDTAVPASGRVYCTAPDGGFIAFFPDRWGFFKRTPYFYINDIEIIDLNINRNDTNLVTHVFTSGPLIPSDGIQIWDRMASMVASIEDEAFKYFIHVPDDFNTLDFLAKYGARPYVNDIQNINNPLLLWMNGWMKFMELWSQRFTASASFTFMPELFPGGLVSFGNRVQMFLESVTHSFDMAGGFTTTAELSSLTSLDPKTFSDIANGGQLDPIVVDERFG